MKVYYQLEDFKLPKKTTITTGTFDGVHIGHRTIINQLNKLAAETGTESVLLTFWPHPRKVLFPDGDPIELINTIDEKIKLLRDTGLQHLIIYPFSKEFSRLTAQDFVRNILVDKLKLKEFVIGYDHQFGRNREGNVQQLRELGSLYNFNITQINAQTLDEVNISSTKIRNAIKQGDVALANSYLNYNFQITGKVVKGKQLGRTIGFPTANLDLGLVDKILPKNGVYSCFAVVNNQKLKGMLNIGLNPTVENSSKIKIEVNLFDFNGNLYGQEIQLQVINRLRDEQKFKSTDSLTLQLKKDKLLALQSFAK